MIGFRARFIALLCCSIWICAPGCGPKSSELSDGRSTVGANAGSGRLLDPVENPRGVSYSGWLKVAVQPLGSVPYDRMTLPLVSPDGRWLAVQTGVAPRWPTILAEPGASLPMLTRVEIYALDRRDEIQPFDLKAPVMVTQVAEMALLGRSCDEEGFLIESPREDGSRWIGKVAWADASVRWLVDGPHVNAFAALGPEGQLAWSRRAVEAQHYDLMVRTSQGEWNLPSQGNDWLMPQWSGRGDGLFAFQLNGKQLQLRYGFATSSAHFLSMMQSLPIVNDGKIYHAYQSLIAQSGVAEQAERDQLVYFHPGMKRVAVWRPQAASGQRNFALNAGSLAAAVDQDDSAFVAMQGELVRLNIRNVQTTMDLVPGPQIPRSTPGSNWPFLLLSPDQDRIKLMAMRLIPPDKAAGKMPGQ
jgi:hypothetical protein